MSGIVYALEEMGRYVYFVWMVLCRMRYAVFYAKEMFQHIVFIGVRSVPIVAVTGLFAGLILGLQIAAAMNSLISGGARLSSPGIILALVREFGPVLTSLILVSRVCSSVTAELGTMKVSQQIDALRTLSVDPINYLVVPRVVAGMICLPVLGWFSIIAGFFGSGVMLVSVHGITVVDYLSSAQEVLIVRYVVESVIKLMIFGFTLLTISTFEGFRTEEGAVGVGKSTIRSVVASSFSIIFLDYLIGTIFIVMF